MEEVLRLVDGIAPRTVKSLSRHLMFDDGDDAGELAAFITEEGTTGDTTGMSKKK